MAKRTIEWYGLGPCRLHEARPRPRPFIALGSARLRSLVCSLSSWAGGDDSLSDDCARRRSAFHSFGRLSLKIFTFDHTAVALSRLSARALYLARVKDRLRVGSRTESEGWYRTRGEEGVKRGGKGPRAFVTFRGYPDACRRIGFDPRGCQGKVSTRPSFRARARARTPLALTLNNARMFGGGFNIKAEEGSCL